MLSQRKEGLWPKSCLVPMTACEKDVHTLAKEYIAKKKREEAVATLKKALGEKLGTYEAVTKLTARLLITPTLQGGVTKGPVDVGSFLSAWRGWQIDKGLHEVKH